jgi:flagellar biosynthetic protein FlhB
MSEEQEQKTEEASQRKLDQAREKGQVTLSRDVVTGFMFAAIGAIVLLSPPLAASLARTTAAFFERPHQLPIDRSLFTAVLGEVGLVVAVPLALLAAAAVVGTLIQTGFLASGDKIRPKLSHISPMSGWKRIFSMRALAEFGKGLLKLVIVGAALAWVLLPVIDRLALLPGFSIEDTLRELYGFLVRMMMAGAGTMVALALLDYLHQRFQFLRSMRMSKQEVKEEYKQTEGDPHIKGRIRQIRAERARRRMMAAVPEASVVITNPTHFAVALQYEMQKSNAPKLVAKGTDLVALKIREIAKEHNVPIVENPPLARALHAAVDLDEEIPQEHYKAVAEVIGFVLRQQGKLKTPQSRAGL